MAKRRSMRNGRGSASNLRNAFLNQHVSVFARGQTKIKISGLVSQVQDDKIFIDAHEVAVEFYIKSEGITDIETRMKEVPAQWVDITGCKVKVERDK